MAIDWTLVTHADELLFLLYLIVWLVQWLIGIVGRAPSQAPKP